MAEARFRVPEEALAGDSGGDGQSHYGRRLHVGLLSRGGPVGLEAAGMDLLVDSPVTRPSVVR